MSVNRLQLQDFLTASGLPLRVVVALVLIGHGLIHVMGFVLFLVWENPGTCGIPVRCPNRALWPEPRRDSSLTQCCWP